MAENTKPTMKGSNEQTKQEKALGGFPPTKDVPAVMKANTPGVRKAPEGYRPS